MILLRGIPFSTDGLWQLIDTTLLLQSYCRYDIDFFFASRYLRFCIISFPVPKLHAAHARDFFIQW